MSIEGGCNCGAIRYRIDAEPMAVAACHCANCRRQSGAAFSVNLLVPEAAMTVTGTLASYQDTDTDSGQPVQRQFCGACGSPIRSVIGSMPGMVAVKAGTLDNAGAYAPAVHVWLQSALPWAAASIPDGVPKFDKTP